MHSHSQTFAALSFKSIWIDFWKNPSQNTIFGSSAHSPFFEGELRLLKTFSFFFFFFSPTLSMFQISSSPPQQEREERGHGYIILASCFLILSELSALFLYSIAERKICSVKCIIRTKTIINFNYNRTIYFAQGNRVGYKKPNVANLQTDIILLYFRSVVFILMMIFFLNGSFI